MSIAKLKNLRMSPRKVRLVAGLVRGLMVEEAEKQLRFSTKKAAETILKLLHSAVANAKQNDDLEKENLYIAKIIVDGGRPLKRWRPRAMGRASQILKRTSHITLSLEQKGALPEDGKPKEKAEAKPTEEKQELLPKGEVIAELPEKTQKIEKKTIPQKPYAATSQSKKRFFSRQSEGGGRKMFRRKKI